MDLPEYIEICPVCVGLGEYKQTYTAGCGMGTYRSVGPCSYCKNPNVFMRGLGYRMKDGSEVPLSVINQMDHLMTKEK